MLGLGGKEPMSGGCASRNGLPLLSSLQRLFYIRLVNNGFLPRGYARNWAGYPCGHTPGLLCARFGDSGAGQKSLPKQYVSCDKPQSNSSIDCPIKAPLIEPQPVRFSLLYGFFVVMGGFVVDVSHLHNPLSRLTISPKGAAFLARHGHSLKISDSTIRDKSKADILAKTLVCVQVSWTLVQTIARRIVGYPITLLEVHTLVHVACAIGIYGLWFQKPLDVRDPVWVDASEFEDLLALMLVRNYGFGSRVTAPSQEGSIPVKAVQHVYANGSESAYLHVYSKCTEANPAAELITGAEKQKSSSDPVRQPCNPSLSCSATLPVTVHQRIRSSNYSLEPSSQDAAVCTVKSGEALSCGIGPAMTVQSIWSKPNDQLREGHLSISLTRKDMRRWNLAAQALKRTGEELYYDKSKSSVNYLTHYNHSIFLDRKGLQAGFYAYFRAWASGGLIAALTVCMFYGAAHTTAWKFAFPTDVERLLWRIACVDTIGGVISLLAIFSIVVFLHEHDFKMLLRAFFAQEKGIMPLLYRMLIVVGIINIPFFIVSRLYIIVETFISLRHVQWGVYATVNWTDYIPHL